MLHQAFYLLYGRDPQLPIHLQFQVPVIRYSTVEMEYGQELARELKQAHTIAIQNISKEQWEQKKYYDQKNREV